MRKYELDSLQTAHTEVEHSDWYHQFLLYVWMCLLLIICSSDAPFAPSNTPLEPQSRSESSDIVDVPQEVLATEVHVSSYEEFVHAVLTGERYIHFDLSLSELEKQEIIDFIEDSNGFASVDFAQAVPMLESFAESNLRFTDQHVPLVVDADCMLPLPLDETLSDVRRFVKQGKLSIATSSVIHTDAGQLHLTTLMPLNPDSYEQARTYLSRDGGPFSNLGHGALILNDLLNKLDHTKTSAICSAYPDGQIYGSVESLLEQDILSLIFTRSLSMGPVNSEAIREAVDALWIEYPETLIYFFNSLGNDGVIRSTLPTGTSWLAAVAAYHTEGILTDYTNVLPLSEDVPPNAVVGMGTFSLENTPFPSFFSGTSAATPWVAGQLLLDITQYTPSELAALRGLPISEVLKRTLSAEEELYQVQSAGFVEPVTHTLPISIATALNTEMAFLSEEELQNLDTITVVLSDVEIDRIHVYKNWRIRYPFTQDYYDYSVESTKGLIQWISSGIDVELQFVLNTGEVKYQQISELPTLIPILKQALQDEQHDPMITLKLNNFTTTYQKLLTVPSQDVIPAYGGRILLPFIISD